MWMTNASTAIFAERRRPRILRGTKTVGIATFTSNLRMKWRKGYVRRRWKVALWRRLGTTEFRISDRARGVEDLNDGEWR